MNRFNKMSCSLAIVVALLFSFSGSVQAAKFKEGSDLLGPETQRRTCDGPDVGRATIEAKGTSLANKIVGRIFKKNKSNHEVLVKIRVSGGSEETTFNVIWSRATGPGACYQAGGGNRFFVGTFTTDEDGNAREFFRIKDGNPFPGENVALLVCTADDGQGCLGFNAPGSMRYTSVFNQIPPAKP